VGAHRDAERHPAVDEHLRRVLLVTHRPLDQPGGPAARWRSLVRYLPEEGWEVDVLAAPTRAGAVEFATREADRRRAAARARVMGAVGRISSPAFGLLGIRPEAVPLSTAWVPRATRRIRERVAARRPDVVLATGPPMAALMAARLAHRDGSPPLVVELRDLWAGNPAFDRRGGMLGRLESWVFGAAAAIVAMTPEAVTDIRGRHPDLAERVHEIPNGFEPELLSRRPPPQKPGTPITLLHSGTLSADRPLRPLLSVLAREPHRSRFRLVLHGFLVPEIQRQVAEFEDRVTVEVVPPSTWDDAVERIASADATLVSQARGAGDATAVAAKVYEYLALGKPVLAVTDGGATEALLRRLGADGLAARLSDERSIERALDRIAAGDVPEPVTVEQLESYDRRQIARRTAALLDNVAG
jgi:glycosyltransferase involved in cell wall biosynthesis